MAIDYRQRIDRLLRIITLIQGGRGWTPSTLAAELGCVQRTVFRDLGHLKECGIPILYDAATRQYAMDGQFFMPPVQLSLDESLALLSLCEHVAEREQIPFMKAAGRAAQKIASQLPSDLRADLAMRGRNMAIRTAAAMEADGYADVYDRMQTAIAGKHLLRCKYDPASSDDDQRRRRAGHADGEFDFAPYALFFCVRAWYVIGKRSDRDGLRCLKLSRFTKVQPTDEPYSVPRSFSLEKHLGNAWRMMRGKDAEVELWFDPEFADTISDTRWHRTQEFVSHPDGSCTFTATVSGFDEIVWWILSMGPHCKVIRPKALGKRVRDLAAQTAARYRTEADIIADDS
jgi:predicted DNA-binding transcriptional regulator YafY